MAGTSDVTRSHFPHGNQGYVLWRMGGSFDIGWSAGDTIGAVAFDLFRVPFDCFIKEAYLSMMEAEFAGTSPKLSLVDDSGQTIISEITLSTSHDNGTVTEMTINDEGPVLTGGVLDMQVDSDTNGIFLNMYLTLYVLPKYR